jgi:predicted nucleotidyltransferase
VQTKCDNAVRAVRKAIDCSDKLNIRSIEVFAQGSYANRTNVRKDSDIDICVLCIDTFFPDYSMSQGLNNAVRLHGRPVSLCRFQKRCRRCAEILLRCDCREAGQQGVRRSCKYLPGGCRCGALLRAPALCRSAPKSLV